MQTSRFGMVIFFLFLYNTSILYASPDKQPLRLGMYDIEKNMWTPLLKNYLINEIESDVKIVAASNADNLIEKFRSDEMDLAYLSPTACSHSGNNNAKLILKSTYKGKTFFQFTIIIHKDSQISRLEDLVGKRFAFRTNPSLLQRASLLKTGLSLKDFTQVKYLKNNDKIIEAVINKNIDAGIVDDLWAINSYNRGIRILHSSLPIPLYCIAVNKKLNNEFIDKIRQAFLNLDNANPQHKDIFKSFSFRSDSFSDIRKDDYFVVQNLTTFGNTNSPYTTTAK